MSRVEIAKRVNAYLSPSSPIRREEQLVGRASQLDTVIQALATTGRCVFIYGDRGVGKTSLAQTAAFLYQSSDGDPVLATCDPHTTFYEFVRDIAVRLVGESPDALKKSVKKRAGLKAWIIDAGGESSVETGVLKTPTTINQAVDLLSHGAALHSQEPVVVVDEFDRLSNAQDRALFGDLIKQIGDQEIPLKLVLSGVGRSLTELLAGHESSYRYLASVHLERLKVGPLAEILDHAAGELGLDLDKYKIRIAVISDGFPHYVHLIGSKLIWEMLSSETPTAKPSLDQFERAVDSALAEVEAHLRQKYDQATKKYNDDYEVVLWAVANHPDLQRRSADIFESYNEIAEQLDIQPLERSTFNNRLNSLKKDAHGNALVATRQGWYEFREPVLRGFCRMKAILAGVELEGTYYY